MEGVKPKCYFSELGLSHLEIQDGLLSNVVVLLFRLDLFNW